ncbi:MAG: thioredoxin [Candidatus Thiodiazotropha sp. (ex Lucinoma kastoroae)]|nr:thioredoxin [Candidatus Thiodiazotropha sp. (ex Lucinoma kastoroae)]
MNTPLNPWLDAKELAHRLNRPGARLTIVIGAEGWCQKCRDFWPIFDAQAQKASANETWLWLDMEEHAEFVGSYLPPDLPMLICYENAYITNLQPLKPGLSGLEHALTHPETDTFRQDPGIRARLIEENWAI